MAKKAKEDPSDGSIADYSFDAEGVMNMSYCPPEWGPKKAAWPDRDVCLCIPAYKPLDGQVVFTFMALAMKYRQGIRLEMRWNDSMIARSRNQLAKRFLDTGASWCIWFDTDMLFPIGHSGIFAQFLGAPARSIAEKYLNHHTIERLLSWKRNVVGGCYWDRLGTGRLIAAGSQPILNPIPSDTLYAANFKCS